MVEKVIMPGANVVDFARYQQGRSRTAFAVRACRHCGAALSEGESEDDCSTVLGVESARKFIAD